MQRETGYPDIAARCNEDIRFIAANWRESSESLQALLDIDGFLKLFNKLATAGRTSQSPEVWVAAVYAYRLQERRPKIGGTSPKHGNISLY